ncbi:MAG: hypothetical protein AAB511_04020 [Patescibacteria group bacterium]
MKKIIFLLAFALFSGSVAHAQLIDAKVNVSAKTDVGVEQRNANASTSANTKVDGGAKVGRDMTGNDSDSDVKTTSASAVSLEARTIQGWNDQEKSDFLLTVKTHAQLQSGQDLENFAKGVMASDEHVKAVAASDTHVEVNYRLPAKFLGVFKTDLDALADVSFDQEKKGSGPKEVTVRFPWYRMFFSLDSDVRADVLQSAIEASVKSDSDTLRADASANVTARNGRVIQLISAILKNIRASVDAEAEATVK